MSETAQAAPTPATEPVAFQPAAEIISPAEAKSWQEWADKGPALLRERVKMFEAIKADFMPLKVGGIALGVALTVASFTKYIPGKWKWVSGTGAAVSFVAGMLGNTIQSVSSYNQFYLDYADILEKEPAVREKLADFLSKSVTPADIKQFGMDGAVTYRIDQFAHGENISSSKSYVSDVRASNSMQSSCAPCRN